MKKLVVFAVIAMTAICASAQSFYAISGVETHDRSFYVTCSTGRVPVNVLIYRAVQAEPDRFVVVTIQGDNYQTVTVCDRSDIFTEVHEVDSVGMNEAGNPLVFFTDGETFCEEDSTWFALNKGQKLEKFSLLGLTKNFWQWRTVPRSVEAHGKQVAAVEVVPAPKAAAAAEEKPVSKPTPSATVPAAKPTMTSANYSGMSKAEAKAAKAAEEAAKAEAKAAEKAAKAKDKAEAKARKAAEKAAGSVATGNRVRMTL